MTVPFRNLIRSVGRPAIGTFVKIPSLEIAEILGETGYDFVVIDTEHALLSVREVYPLIVTYSRMGVAPLVRLPDHGYGDGQRYLDAGAAGLLVPHVADGAEAAATMRRFLFPPRGTRGMGYAARAGLWGALPGGPAEYVRAGQDDVVRVAMVEDHGAVAGIAGILAAPGVDAVFVGPGDLSLSMGTAPDDPVVGQAVDAAVEAAVHAGVPVGTVARTEDQIRRRIIQGCRFVLVDNDTSMVAGAARTHMTTVQQVLADIVPDPARQPVGGPDR